MSEQRRLQCRPEKSSLDWALLLVFVSSMLIMNLNSWKMKERTWEEFVGKKANEKLWWRPSCGEWHQRHGAQEISQNQSRQALHTKVITCPGVRSEATTHKRGRQTWVMGFTRLAPEEKSGRKKNSFHFHIRRFQDQKNLWLALTVKTEDRVGF